MLKAEGRDPKLSLKAADTRHMLHVCHWLLTNVLKPETDHERLVLLCVTAIHDFYVALRAWGPDAGKTCARLGRQHIVLFSELSREALASENHRRTGWMAYRFYPKHHLFVHLCEEELFTTGNPMDYWCYLDEDAIGIAITAAKGQRVSYLHRSLILKYNL